MADEPGQSRPKRYVRSGIHRYENRIRPMIAPLPQPHSDASGSLPSDLEALAPPPLLLPGESLQRYQMTRRVIMIELGPRSVIEWLLATCGRTQPAPNRQRPK